MSLNVKYKYKQNRAKKGWHIGLNRGLLGWSGVLFTVAFSLTGAYAFGVPFFTENGELIEVEKFFAILGGVGLILFTFEYLRGKSWTAWLNSNLDALISSFLPVESDVKRMSKKYRHLFFAAFLTLGLFAGDVFGAWSLKNIINQKFISWHMENNKAYQGELVKLRNHTKTYLSDKEFSLELNRLKQEEAQRRHCNKKYPLPKWKGRNSECFNTWLSEHKQSKLSLLGTLETEGLIADSFPKAYKEAVDFAKPYQWFMFGLFLFVAIMAHYLANRDSNEQMMNMNIETKRKIESSKLEGYAEVKKIELQAVQNNTEDFKRLVKNNFKKSEEKKKIPMQDYSKKIIVKGEDGEFVEGEIVAKAGNFQVSAENPIGFRVGEEPIGQAPLKPKDAPTMHRSNMSGYFDDGYDLTLAILCLFDFGERGAGDDLLTNKQMHALYLRHPKKRNELVLNQISKMVKEPLKVRGLISSKAGYPDRANFNVDVVLDELGLIPFWAEITS